MFKVDRFFPTIKGCFIFKRVVVVSIDIFCNTEDMIKSNPQNQEPINQTTLPVAKFPIAVFVLSLIIVAIVSGGTVYFVQQSKIEQLQSLNNIREREIPAKTEPTNIIPTAGLVENLESTLVSIDKTWNLYTNSKSGFSMKLPKTVETWHHDNCPKRSNVPVVAFDDASGSYITVKTFYEFQKSAEDKTCPITENSLSIIDERTNQRKSDPRNILMVPNNWHIVTAKAENDSDIDTFVKANYGMGCRIGAKSLSPAGVYDVKIEGDGLDLDTTKCPINFIYVVKYSPEFKKAATWGVGQEVVFSSENYKVSYDGEMINSFKFVN